ncbi:hypothetical protein MTBBW1_1880026 [Desulfamplus magnetovallimortis]|uniref:Uncharacterized protein n=1 Tax=Desulfamplus magnetovallimortis TaxID=1246637 RepID=A0A1W1HAX5_9BACT|nr:hypothetical protein [Desulfamplus magnetovallimortis]SLM29589.1 hypothetical protein MTBBW1_1880026 [Desulfamplus magnetovallimortis]
MSFPDALCSRIVIETSVVEVMAIQEMANCSKAVLYRENDYHFYIWG